MTKQMAARAYRNNGEEAARKQRILDYLPLVHHVLGRLPVVLPPHLDYEDLVSAGTCGLIQAAASYDPSKGSSFKTHAYTRVRGAIIDELRRADGLSRQARGKVKKLQRASDALTQQLGREPSPDELGAELGIGSEELDEVLGLAQRSSLISLEHEGEGGEDGGGLRDLLRSFGPPPEDRAARAELVEALRSALTTLKPREREVVGLYYHEGLRLREIGGLLGVSESRVCQLHPRALRALRSALSQRGFVRN